jgi:hypothetical protein
VEETHHSYTALNQSEAISHLMMKPERQQQEKTLFVSFYIFAQVTVTDKST